MKQAVKNALPRPLFSALRQIRRYLMLRHRPRLTAPLDSSPALGCCVAYARFGGYCVPLASRHRRAAQLILRGELHEPETIDFLAARCGEGDVIHAGTYFGDFLPALSTALAPGAAIWAFEPNPENYRCATITVQINGLQNVQLANAALGERRTMGRLLTNSDDDGRSLGGASRLVETEGGAGGAETVQVQVVTVDDTVSTDRAVSVIHLDVEGHERQALAGALRTILRCRPVLVLESVPDDAWLSENILALGYRVERRIETNTVLTA